MQFTVRLNSYSVLLFFSTTEVLSHIKDKILHLLHRCEYVLIFALLNIQQNLLIICKPILV